jgi:hypothetical protein
VHAVTGIPIVADYYTQLHPTDKLSCRNLSLSDALNRFCDVLGLQWKKEGEWLQFRAKSYYQDRLKEVPNRLLYALAAARRQQGHLTLHQVVEIAQLPDAQLDGQEMAEGARECFGLAEWQLARYAGMRPRLRFLARLSPAQREQTMSAAGLPFTRMTLPQQQQFMALALQFDSKPLRSLEELDGAALRVEYTRPGSYRWGNPDDYHPTRWAVSLAPGPEGRRVPRPPVIEPTREAVVAGIRTVDPDIREAIWRARIKDDPRLAASPRSDEAEVFPTRLGLTVITIPGGTNARAVHIWFENSDIGY